MKPKHDSTHTDPSVPKAHVPWASYPLTRAAHRLTASSVRLHDGWHRRYYVVLHGVGVVITKAKGPALPSIPLLLVRSCPCPIYTAAAKARDMIQQAGRGRGHLNRTSLECMERKLLWAMSLCNLICAIVMMTRLWPGTLWPAQY